MLIDREPLLPTLYRVLCHDATLIDCEGEALYPRGTQLEFTVTTLVIWLPRQAVGPRCRRAETERRRGLCGLRGDADSGMRSGHLPPRPWSAGGWARASLARASLSGRRWSLSVLSELRPNTCGCNSVGSRMRSVRRSGFSRSNASRINGVV